MRLSGLTVEGRGGRWKAACTNRVGVSIESRRAGTEVVVDQDGREARYGVDAIAQWSSNMYAAS